VRFPCKLTIQLDPAGSVSALWSGVKVRGSGAGGVDVFNVPASMFANSSSWALENLTPGQTLIFNVSGSAGTFNNGGISFTPLDNYNNVLFNSPGPRRSRSTPSITLRRSTWPPPGLKEDQARARTARRPWACIAHASTRPAPARPAATHCGEA